MFVTSARFSPVYAKPLPLNVKVYGVTFAVSPLYSPYIGPNRCQVTC
jgi:hypothetical protein